MQIANPIYDAVFKYLLNDNKVAKLLLSAIIGEEILELEFRATEQTLPLQQSITVLRMDFNALVRYEDGTEQLIIIELQKAKLHTDIMRFRRYLGQQYSDSKNAREIKSDEDGDLIRKKAYPILSIYFLGHTLDHYKKIPIIKSARRYIDVTTGDILSKKEEFIESLTHDSIVIQIPALKGKRRTELEQLLAIFDQTNQAKDYHILNIKEEDVPDRYKPVVRRLLKAFADAQIRELMHTEDELIEEMQNYSRALSKKDEKIQAQSDKLQAKEKELAAKNKSIETVVRSLHEADFSLGQIAKMTNLTVKQVQNILGK